jgi:streptogramin lyase
VSDIAAGEGAIWVTNYEGFVARIDPKTVSKVASIRLGHRPTAVAAGAGFVWVVVQ